MSYYFNFTINNDYNMFYKNNNSTLIKSIVTYILLYTCIILRIN